MRLMLLAYSMNACRNTSLSPMPRLSAILVSRLRCSRLR